MTVTPPPVPVTLPLASTLAMLSFRLDQVTFVLDTLAG